MGFPDKDFIKGFIIIYKSHPALWNFKSPISHDKHLREKGIADLIEFSKKTHTIVDEVFVKKKIKNLRNSFLRERKKVQKSKCKNSSTQDFYVPLLWYYDLISFISEDVNDGISLSITNNNFKNNMVQDDQSSNESTSDSGMSNCDDHIYSMRLQNNKHKPNEGKSVSISSESDDVCVESGKILDMNTKINIRKKDDISYSLKYHKSSVPDSEINMFKITCSKCDLQFLKSEYPLHFKRTHNYKCHLCDKIFARMKTLENHKKIMHKHKMDVNTNQITNVPPLQTNQFQIVKNLPIYINEPQTLSDSRNLTEHSLINDVHILPVNSIGMKNIEGVNKSQTHLNNILFDELDQFIEVHELSADIEMTNIGIKEIGVSHQNDLQTNRNNSLIEELSQFVELNKVQTNIEMNKEMGQSKNLKNIKKNTQPTQNICSICNLQFIYQHEYNTHMEKKHIYHINNEHELQNINSNIEMSVNEPNHLNKTTMYKLCESQINSDKTDIIEATNLQVDVKNNVSNFIPVIQQKGMKINSVGSVSCTSSMNIMCDEYDTKFASTQNINNYLKVKPSYPCNMCTKSFVNKSTMISHMQVIHKQSTNIPKSICKNTIIQSYPNFKLDAQIQSNTIPVNKPGVQKEVKMMQELEENKVVDLLSEIEINKYVKFEYFDDMQAGKGQINSSKNKGGLRIVPNDEQTDKNNIHEHDQQNEMLNLLHHNIHLQDVVAYPPEEKKPVTKHTEYMCDMCNGYLSTRSSLKRHSLLDHKYNCDNCKKKFRHGGDLDDHIRSTHAYDNKNKKLKLQLDNIKKDDLANQAAIYQINCNKNKGILSIASNDEQMHENNVLKHDQQNEVLNLLHHNIHLQDLVAYPPEEKKPVTKHTEYMCDMCNGYLSTRSSLKRHSLLDHKYNCDNCKKKFRHGGDLDDHIRSTHAYDNKNKKLKLQPDNIKKDDLANQAAIYQINCNKNKGILSIASNDEQMHENNVLKHDQQNEVLNLLHHNIKLQDTVAYPHNEKKPLIKRIEYVCNLCDGQFDTQQKLKAHSIRNHKHTCKYCKKKFVFNLALDNHYKNIHANDIAISCIQKGHIDTSSQPDEMLQLQPDNIKKDDLAKPAAIYQINCSNNKDILSIASNDEQMHENNVLKHGQQNEVLNLLHHNIKLQDTVAYPHNEKKPLIKRIEYVCNLCDGQFDTKQKLKAHSIRNHKHTCKYCKKKFVFNLALDNHYKNIHANDIAISCIQKGHIDTSSQPDEMLQLQPDNIKKDDLAKPAAIYQINCSNNKDILPILPNNKQMYINNEQEQNEMQNLLCNDIKDIQVLKEDVMTNPCDEKKTVIKHTGNICHKCGGEFNGNKIPKSHFVAIHKHKCPHCEKIFVRNNALNKHIKSTHNNDNENSCILKKHVYIPTNQLNEMIKFDYDQKDDLANQAAMCQINCSDSKSVLSIEPLQHVVANPCNETNLVSKYTRFTCNICGGQFRSNKVFKKHSVEPHTLECPYCEKKFARGCNLKKHIGNTHAYDNENEMLKLQPNNVKKDDLANQAAIHQSCSSNTHIFPIVSNDAHTHENNLREHKKPNEILVSLPYNIQSEDTVAYPCDEKLHVNKLKGFICNNCEGQFRSKNEFNKHIGKDHKFKCEYCLNKFLSNGALQKHVQVKHIQHSENACMENTNPVTLSQQDEMLKFQSDFIKKDILAIQANEHQINCSKSKSVLPIVLNDTYTNDMLDCGQQNQTQDVWQENIVSEDTVVDMLNEMHINKIDKLSEFEDILPTISQTNCSDINDIVEHSQLKEAKNLQLHNYQLQEEVTTQSNDNEHKRYICRICDAQYKSENKFNQHAQSDHKNKCLYCNKKFISKLTLRKHTRKMHGNQKKNSRFKMFADQVDETFELQSVDIKMENLVDREQLNCNEIKGVLPIVPNDAQVCSSNLSKCVKPCKKQELQLCQKEQLKKYAQYMCNICTVPFKTKTELKRHSVLDHKFKCLKCKKKYVCKTTWENHLCTENEQKTKISLTKMTKIQNTKQNEPKELSTETQLICDFCDSQLKNTYELGYHLLKEHNYKCSLCVKKFVRNLDLVRHKIAEHKHLFENQNKKFHCKECNSRFSTDESLQSHIKYEHLLIPKRYTCPLCTIQLKNIDEFYEHMELYHLAPYQCTPFISTK